jgi:hypothetical protein
MMNYHSDDICVAEINGTSGSTWDISPPNIGRLREELRGGGDVSMYVSVSFTRCVKLRNVDYKLGLRVTFVPVNS